MKNNETADVTGIALLEALADAYNRHDVDGIMALMASDCVFISYFGPDVCGEIFTGHVRVRRRVAAGLADFPDARWEVINHFLSGDRAVSEWIFRGTRRGTTEPVERRGIDIFTLRDGKIQIKDTYQKWRQSAEARQQIVVPGIYAPVGRYAHAVRCRGLVYCSGCGPFDKSGKLVGAGDIVAQMTQTLENVRMILEAAGTSFANVLRESVYLTDINERQATRAVREKFYGSVLPACTLIEISRCVDPEMKVEIDVVASM